MRRSTRKRKAPQVFVPEIIKMTKAHIKDVAEYYEHANSDSDCEFVARESDDDEWKADEEVETDDDEDDDTIPSDEEELDEDEGEEEEGDDEEEEDEEEEEDDEDDEEDEEDEEDEDEEELDEEEVILWQSKMCVLCNSEESNVIFHPCRHMCICGECLIKAETEKCPHCSRTVHTIFYRNV